MCYQVKFGRSTSKVIRILTSEPQKLCEWVPLELGNSGWPQESMAIMPRKTFDDIFRRLGAIECDGQTDRHRMTTSIALTHSVVR